MLVTLFLSVLGGLGALEIVRRCRRAGLLLPAVGLVFLLESTAAPIVLNDVWREFNLKKPPGRVLVGSQAPAIYRAVQTLPVEAVLVEFPFGSSPYELRYMFYSTQHGRRLSNATAGRSPPAINDGRRSARSWAVIGPGRARQLGATYAIVHERGGGQGKKAACWSAAAAGRPAVDRTRGTLLGRLGGPRLSPGWGGNKKCKARRLPWLRTTRNDPPDLDRIRQETREDLSKFKLLKHGAGADHRAVAPR